MVGGKELESLRLRKRVLILESSLNRAALEASWQDLHTATAWLRRAEHTFRQARPWLLLLAPLAGLAVARDPSRPVRLLSRLLGALKWIRPLLGVWQSFAGARAKSHAPQPPEF
jgi:hypothetical protein